MYKNVLSALIAGALSSFALAQHTTFEAELARLDQDVATGRLSPLEADRERLRGIRAHYPNDLVSAAYFESLVDYGEQLEAKKITKKRYEELVQLRLERFRETQLQRRHQAELDQQYQQQEYERQQRVLRNAALLQSIGNAFRR